MLTIFLLRYMYVHLIYKSLKMASNHLQTKTLIYFKYWLKSDNHFTNILKRKFKQWWATIKLKSTKRKLRHLNSLNIKKNTRTKPVNCWKCGIEIGSDICPCNGTNHNIQFNCYNGIGGVIYSIYKHCTWRSATAVKTLVQECCEKSVLFFFLLISFICTSIRISFDFLIYKNKYIY